MFLLVLSIRLRPWVYAQLVSHPKMCAQGHLTPKNAPKCSPGTPKTHFLKHWSIQSSYENQLQCLFT